MSDFRMFYKIRNRESGLYSKGGCCPKWSKNGKTWSNVGHIKNHLNQVRSYVVGYRFYGKAEDPDKVFAKFTKDWEVVHYRVEPFVTQPLAEYLLNVKSVKK